MTKILYAISRPLEGPIDLLAYADAKNPVVWLKNGDGFITRGEILKLSATGKNRFLELNSAWQTACAHALIDDAVQVAGSGLIASGIFAFADNSTAKSVLTVPETVIGYSEGVWFITQISILTADSSVDDSATAQSLPAQTPYGIWHGAVLDGTTETAQTLAHKNRLEKAIKLIDSSKLDKVVLARQVTADLTADNDLRIPITRLTKTYPNCRTFALNGVLGATPETLVKYRNGKLESLVLAGTAPRAENPETDIAARDYLLNDDQMLSEHEFAAQSILNSFTETGAEIDTVKGPFAFKLPNVWHLATAVSGTLKDGNSVLHAAHAVHPSAAVAGTPKDVALQVIDDLETNDRRYYAGTVGWIDANGDGEFAVTLRCAEITNTSDAKIKQVCAWVGGGIVQGSNVADEFQETVTKLEPIRGAFKP